MQIVENKNIHLNVVTKLMKEQLVSIIIPMFNAQQYIEDAIESIQNQTYTQWEVIIVDDASTDDSVEVVKRIEDKRIRLIQLEKNTGAAYSRNIGINHANGRYIAFLDADDLWKEDKLEKQVMFTYHNGYAFTFTGYEFADETGKPLNRVVHVPSSIQYKQALKNTTISTITVMFDLQQLHKEEIMMPLNSTREDTATWWKVLRSGITAYGFDEPLSYYRRHMNSSSANKMKAILGTWKMYRTCEKLSVITTLYYFCFYLMNALRRRL